MHPAVPAVEIACHAHPYGIRGPYCEMYALNAVDAAAMCAQNFISLIMSARRKKIRILLGYHGAEAVGIDDFLRLSFRIFHAVHIIRYPFSRNQGGKISGLIRHFHFYFFAGFPDYRRNLGCTRLKGRKQRGASHGVRPQKLMGIILLRINNRLDLRPVHQLIQFFFHPDSLNFPLYFSRRL